MIPAMHATPASLFVLALASAPLAAQDASAVATPARADQRPALRVIEISGTPWERGFQHGQQLRAEIALRFERWQGEVQRDFHLPLDTFVERFLAGTSYDQAVRKWTPELLDEVRGIAAGAEQPYPRVFAWQLIDEVWAMAGTVLREKCTAIGVDRIGDQPAFAAQNLDIPAEAHGFQVLLRVRDESRGLQTLVVTESGLVAAAGMNSARVAITCNTLLQLRPCRDGLPVAFVVRGVLMQKDQAAALAFLQGVKHASGQNYIVAGPDTAPGFECSAGKVVRWQPWPGAPFTFHTNNPLCNDDFADGYKARVAKSGCDPFVGERPCPRLGQCRKAFGADARPDVAAVKALLASREGAPPVNNATTFASFVMVLGERPELQIAAGRPDVVPFEVFHFAP
jgi:hypothetical protein